jgi:hypothetical protein
MSNTALSLERQTNTFRLVSYHLTPVLWLHLTPEEVHLNLKENNIKEINILGKSIIEYKILPA